MSTGFSELPDEATIRAGKSAIDNIDSVSSPPPDADAAAQRAGDKLPAVIAAARLDLAALAAIVASVATLKAKRKQKRLDARAEETTLDAAYSSIRDLLGILIKAGSREAEALDAFLFPEGVRAVSAARDRAQVGKYQAWFLLADDPTAKDNPAYGGVAAQIESFRGRLGAFETTIQQKEALDGEIKKARAARRKARKTWDVTFRELIDDVARAHGEDSPAFLAWIKPLIDLKAAQAGLTTRRAKAPPAAPVVVTEEGG